jgi:hypothetical protein
MNQKKIDRWVKAKELYIQGRQTPDGLKYPTYDEIAAEVDIKAQTLRLKASKENWTLQRKQFVAKVENLTTEKKSTVMAGESVEFDSECLKAARKGIQLINAEMEKAVADKLPDGATTKEVIDYVVSKKQAIASFGKALVDYQKAGKLAFGENTEADKDITINVKYDDK